VPAAVRRLLDRRQPGRLAVEIAIRLLEAVLPGADLRTQARCHLPNRAVANLGVQGARQVAPSFAKRFRLRPSIGPWMPNHSYCVRPASRRVGEQVGQT